MTWTEFLSKLDTRQAGRARDHLRAVLDGIPKTPPDCVYSSAAFATLRELGVDDDTAVAQAAYVSDLVPVPLWFYRRGEVTL